MAKYMLAYHGGEMAPPEDQEAVMQAWMSWFGELGDAVVDVGNPISVARTINADGSVVDGGGANPVTGYSLVQADDLDVAAALVKGCPVFTYGGSVEVAEAIDI